MGRLGVWMLALLLVVTRSECTRRHWQPQHGADVDSDMAAEQAIIKSEPLFIPQIIHGKLLGLDGPSPQPSHLRRRLSQFFPNFIFVPSSVPTSAASNTRTIGPATATTNPQGGIPFLPALGPMQPPAQQPRQPQVPAPAHQPGPAKAQQQAAAPEASKKQQQAVASSKAALTAQGIPPGEAGPANSGNKQQTANPPNSRPSEAQRLPSRMRTAAGVNQLRGARTRPGTEAAAVAAVQQQDPATPSTDSNSGSSSSSTPTLSTGEQPDTSPPPDQAPDQKPVDTPADQQAQKQQPYCIPNKQGDVFSVLAAGDSITQGSVPSRNRNWPYAIRLTQLLIRKLGIFASAQDAGLGGGGIFMTGFNNPTTFPPFINSYLSQRAWNVVVVMIGINDLLRGGKPAADIMGGLTPIIVDIISRGSPVVLVPPLSAPGFVDQRDSKESERKQLAVLMKDLAAQHAASTNQQGPQVYLLDVQAGPLDFYSMPQSDRDRFLDDGLHLTQYGYDTLGDLVFNEISSHLCEPTA